ncbi:MULTISPECIES: immunoglobulin-like domain-containing protein [Alkalibacterium]|uniref:Uncharacterized protein n=1 Tax=Alkalibacterium gilvum TaxID=1130080 RepID=A0A1H6UZM3_9LACT|nr:MULTISPECIES: immunoglobulin-like domain-containing protein [Alkalibacterium]MDN6294458.1 hypothetical protein [Alkalibacterium sp.]SEI97799.1 hypothetical protein SAMN04488113_14114 [Alkalibacterium gilvum]
MKKIPLLFFILFLSTACTRDTAGDIENPDFLDITHETTFSLQTTEEIPYEIVNQSDETFYFHHLEYHIEENVDGEWNNLDLITIPSPDLAGPTPLREGQSVAYEARLARGGDHTYEAGEYRLRFEGWFGSEEEETDSFDFTIEFNLE